MQAAPFNISIWSRLSPFGHAAITSIDAPLELVGQFNISSSTCTNTSTSSRVICHTRCQNRSFVFTHRTTPLHQAQHLHGNATIEAMEATASSPWKPPRVRTCTVAVLHQHKSILPLTLPSRIRRDEAIHASTPSSNRHRSAPVRTRLNTTTLSP